MIKRRIPVLIIISLLLTLVRTAIISADETKITASDGAANDNFGYFVSISDKEFRLCKNFTR